MGVTLQVDQQIDRWSDGVEVTKVVSLRQLANFQVSDLERNIFSILQIMIKMG